MAKRVRVVLTISAWEIGDCEVISVQETRWESAEISTQSPQLTDLIQRVSAEGLRIVLEKALTP